MLPLIALRGPSMPSSLIKQQPSVCLLTLTSIAPLIVSKLIGPLSVEFVWLMLFACATNGRPVSALLVSTIPLTKPPPITCLFWFTSPNCSGRLVWSVPLKSCPSAGLSASIRVDSSKSRAVLAVSRHPRGRWPAPTTPARWLHFRSSAKSTPTI